MSEATANVPVDLVQATYEFLGQSPAHAASRLFLAWEQLIVEYNKKASTPAPEKPNTPQPDTE